jgi:hypothetical protein
MVGWARRERNVMDAIKDLGVGYKANVVLIT